MTVLIERHEERRVSPLLRCTMRCSVSMGYDKGFRESSGGILDGIRLLEGCNEYTGSDLELEIILCIPLTISNADSPLCP